MWSDLDNKHAFAKHGWTLAWRWDAQRRCWEAVRSTRHPPYSARERRIFKRFDLFYREGHHLHVRAMMTIVASQMHATWVSPDVD